MKKTFKELGITDELISALSKQGIKEPDRSSGKYYS